ncbi:MAG: copper homeostasis protein CutC, partial [Rhodothermaceae bacterium]
RTVEVLEICSSVPFTFHRAFDVTPDAFEALETLKKLGVKRVLTSGQKADVPAGKEILKNLVKKTEGKIIILPGGGINPQNVTEVIKDTGVKEIHLSGKNLFSSEMEFYNREVGFNSNFQMPENKILKTDQKIISEIKTIINAG